MATFSVRSALPKFSGFQKKWPFLRQMAFISDFLVQIRDQRLKIDLSAKNRTEDKKS